MKKKSARFKKTKKRTWADIKNYRFSGKMTKEQKREIDLIINPPPLDPCIENIDLGAGIAA